MRIVLERLVNRYRDRSQAFRIREVPDSILGKEIILHSP